MNFLYAGVKELLQNISEKQGARMDSPESAADIPKFIESFKVWQCFLQFFVDGTIWFWHITEVQVDCEFEPQFHFTIVAFVLVFGFFWKISYNLLYFSNLT